MGTICCSEDSEQKSANNTNKKIEKMLKKLKNNLDQEIKILLLGAGESGKSTLFKQMKLLQDGNFDEDDYQVFINIIRENVISQLRVLILASEQLEIPIENNDLANEIKNLKRGGDWRDEFTKNLQILWNDPGIQKTYHLRDERYHLNDCAEYFFNNIERIRQTNYRPTKEDILQARVRTTGIDETEFSLNDFKFTMVDVGGQRNERRKWIHCFEDVTSIIFVSSLCGYNQTLREDSLVNRMTESLNLFKDICNSPWFEQSSIILFLNKTDLFKEKIKTIGINVYFSDFKGGSDYELSIQHIKSKFLEINENKQSNKRIYAFETCAINTKNIEYIFKSVSDTILQNILDQTGVVF
ncbi:guanine nucleotide-binding protein g(o) subunit alpha [Anaeramoeba flamelloides]|uniref:Guanine nucleotide-binding protein g(O) subunit alpha n=1 Tax=Anaeramoeba flamelloides TaxID=1746091 RepID=A0AAV7YM07_9EUKA|nr:guanine nucleotide-binding protein g(o) subunit alpha [Anaeramoeba flamelloides]KAJ6247402.1 guanine nucleotide-binding protein g(o) subunit alpha [Anaeramoeba flamelloides]